MVNLNISLLLHVRSIGGSQVIKRLQDPHLDCTELDEEGHVHAMLLLWMQLLHVTGSCP